MTESERETFAYALQNTAIGRLAFSEIVSAVEYMEAIGYEITKKPEPVVEAPAEMTEAAVVEGDHA